MLHMLPPGIRRKDTDGDKAAVPAKRARVAKEKDMPPPPPRSSSGPHKSASKSAQAASGQAKDKAAPKAKPAAPGGGHTGGPLVPLPVVQSVCSHDLSQNGQCFGICVTVALSFVQHHWELVLLAHAMCCEIDILPVAHSVCFRMWLLQPQNLFIVHH